MRVFVAAIALCCAGAASAPPIFAQGPFHDTPAGPRALPGDVLPPFGMLDDGGHLPPPPPLPPGMTMPGTSAARTPGPTLIAAARMAGAAVRVCARGGFHVGAAVVDSNGRMRAMLEGDGADGSHGFVAMRKAEVALAFGEASSAAQAAVLKDPSLASKVTPAMFVEGGAVPLRRGGRVIGAIGVSGAMGAPIGHADEVCAAAAAGLLR